MATIGLFNGISSPASYDYLSTSKQRHSPMMSVVAQLGKKPIQIRIADPAVAPTFSKFGGVTGSITSGDLFYIDANRISTDIYVTLYLTNTWAKDWMFMSASEWWRSSAVRTW